MRKFRCKQFDGLMVGGLILLAILQQSCTGPADLAMTKRYKLYCVNNRIEISTRTPGDMKWARGDQLCSIKSFDTLAEAEAAANHFCRIGAGCLCHSKEGGPEEVKCAPKSSGPS